MGALYAALRLDAGVLAVGYLAYGWRGAIVALGLLILLQKAFGLAIWVWSLFVPVPQAAPAPPVNFDTKLDE